MSNFLYWEFAAPTHFEGLRGPKQAAVKVGSPTATIPGEKRVVERMRALRAEGIAYDKLAERLTSEGFKTRKGTAWHGFSVQRILARSVEHPPEAGVCTS